MIAADAVLLLLGERWQQAIPLVQTLVLISLFSAFTYAGSYLLLALGKVSVQASLSWLRFGLLALIAIVIFPEAGAQEIAYIRLVTTALGLVFLAALVLHYVKSLRLGDFVRHTWRSIFSTAIMALTLAVFPKIDALALVTQVIFSIVVGASTYACSILLLWRASGCGDGAESYLLDQIGVKNQFIKLMRCRNEY